MASILLICVTPIFGGIFTLLLVAQVARGWVQGVVQPMMFSVQAKAVGPHRQGAVVGLRQTMNRLAAIVIPPLVGGIADQWGPGQSFAILGAVLIAGSGSGVWCTAEGTPEFSADRSCSQRCRSMSCFV